MFQGPRLRDWQALLELLVDTTMPRTYQKPWPEHTQSGNSSLHSGSARWVSPCPSCMTQDSA